MILRPQYSYRVREGLVKLVGITEAHRVFRGMVPGILEIINIFDDLCWFLLIYVDFFWFMLIRSWILNDDLWWFMLISFDSFPKRYIVFCDPDVFPKRYIVFCDPPPIRRLVSTFGSWLLNDDLWWFMLISFDLCHGWRVRFQDLRSQLWGASAEEEQNSFDDLCWFLFISFQRYT